MTGGSTATEFGDADWRGSLTDELANTGSPWLAGTVVLVAGGGLSGPAGGIGFAFSWLCARQGASIAVLDRDPAAGARTVDEIRRAGGQAEWFQVEMTDDVSVAAAVAAVVRRFGRVDVVADSVGGGGTSGMLTVEPDHWQRVMDLNFTSAWSLLRHVAPHLGPGASVVFISSTAVERRGPGLPYAIAKAALERLAVGAAGTLARRGVRVNCVRAGMIWGAFAAREMSEAQREIRSSNVALGVEGTTWDIASAALFLSTRQARWITGQVLTVDGGGAAPVDVGQAGGAGQQSGIRSFSG